jgi:hypothetical protein
VTSARVGYTLTEVILLSATDCSSMLVGSKAGGSALVIGSEEAAELEAVQFYEALGAYQGREGDLVISDGSPHPHARPGQGS